MHKFLTLILASVAAVTVFAADPTDTHYSYSECRGSWSPYPDEVNPAVYPDSLTPVFINHVGRHGARYPASSASCIKLADYLNKADSAGTITPQGRRLAKLNDLVMTRSNGRWGALDSLGEAEQRALATRMFYNFGEVFSKPGAGSRIDAISSYSPRCMMSMYTFLHQLDRMDNRIEFTATTGRCNSALMRPFDLDTAFIEYRKNGPWHQVYDDFFGTTCPTAPARRLMGERYSFSSDDEMRQVSWTAYNVVAGCAAMSVQVDAKEYFTESEYNALWSCLNMRQYLVRTATTISTLPADIAADLLADLISSTDRFIAEGAPAARLRFGHAETLMPLLSLMRLRGCYYMTNYFDTVGLHWRDFYVVPMAANLQMILFRAQKSGRYYLRVDLNEQPVPLQPNSSTVYLPWDDARKYLQRCLPLDKQF